MVAHAVVWAEFRVWEKKPKNPNEVLKNVLPISTVAASARQGRNGVSLSVVCSADVCPMLSLLCLSCFNNAPLASCAKISFSTGGVTKQRRSAELNVSVRRKD